MPRQHSPTDYPARAEAYRRQASHWHAQGAFEMVVACEEFARRCDQMAAAAGNSRPVSRG